MRFYELSKDSEAALQEYARYTMEHEVQAKSYLGKVSNSSGYEDSPNTAPNCFMGES